MIQTDLELVADLERFFPRMWAQCLSGRLDLGRAAVAQAYLAMLTNDEDRAAYAALVEEFLDRQDDPDAAIHPVRYSSLQRAAWRRSRQFEQKTKDESFAHAFAKRRVRLRLDDNGIASLVCTTSVDQGQRADYRLTLLAKKRAQEPGEDRTIEQLRADTLIELVLGRVTVAASNGQLEHDDTSHGDDPVGPSRGGDATGGDGGDPVDAATAADWSAGVAWHEVGRFARPVVNVTVPVTTLMGLDDTPGRLAGGVEVPADLARLIASEPGATWYRLLTDPAGGFVELSTEGYTPTAPIWRWTVARDPVCVYPGCERPATVVEIDHRTEYPAGATSTGNLQPLCEHHHKVKHSRGFHVRRDEDGSYTWSSRYGSTFRKPAPEYPTATWPESLPLPLVERVDDPLEESPHEFPLEMRLEPDPTSPMEHQFAALIGGAA